MSGYQAQVDALRKAAATARAVSEQASEAKLAAAIDGSAEAMPGSRSATLLHHAGSALGTGLAGWSTRATAYAGNLSAAADKYSANEHAAADDFRTHELD